MGPRHRTKTRPPREHARESICPNPTRTGSARNIPPRTPRQGIYHRVQKPVRGAILLRQKERRKTPTSAGLPEAQRMDPPKRHTTPTHSRTHHKSPRSQSVHQVRHSLGVQQHTDTRWRPMEGSIHHKPWSFRATGDVLRDDQLPSHLPDHDEHAVQRRTPAGLAVNLHGRHPHTHPIRPPIPPNKSSPNPRQTTQTRPLPQTREMRLRTKRSRIPRRYLGSQHHPYGPSQGARSSRLETPTNGLRHQSLSRLYRILPILHQRLLEDRKTTDPPNEEGNAIYMGRSPNQSLRNPQETHVPEPNPTSTRLHQTILPSHGRIRIRHGSRTLTGGRQTPQKNLTNQTPHSLLLRDIHPNRTQPRHLREGTPGADESPSPLATPPSRIDNPDHGPHRPREPDLLEIPTQGKLPHSTLVRRTLGIPPKDPTRARETPHLGRPPIQTARGRQRRDRQSRHNPVPPRQLHQTVHHRRPQRRMVGTRTANRDNATKVPRRNRKVDQMPQSDHDPLTQR
jgi:hypothetical protein